MQTAKEIVIKVQEIEPRLRHQTIFNTFDQLRKGESLIIHNNHDPKPVFYQLMDIRGNIFSWDYLQEGPEWWDIRLTKVVESISPNIEEFVLNVPGIAPQSKHAAIFQVFEGTAPGGSFIIHNDHDPKPVYHQLISQYGEIFEWEYLSEGPQRWDIRIIKKQMQAMEKEGETVINVPSLPGHLKHQTIFQAFNNLKPGASFIIHNDHDPKPVYYQLMDMKGDIFTWEYLQEGPEWWDIRVSLKDYEQSTPTYTNPFAHPGEKVVNVPSLEPKLKHPTIFQTFNSLQAGESMIIHNDHDPKPVYYQLKSERGDGFTWEYLQEGPKDWDIRITIKPKESTETIGEIVAKDINKAAVFKKYGIDFCCNGKRTVREACEAKGLDPQQIEEELRKPIQNVSSQQMNYEEWNLSFLADFIVNTHHSYTKKYLPEINQYAKKVAQVHGDKHSELIEIRFLVEKINEEMTKHMKEEEEILFPMIKKIEQAKNEGTSFTSEQSLGNMVHTAEQEHDTVGRALEQIRKLSTNYTIPDDACTSYKLLYSMLQDLENDIFTHIHLENNILFEKAINIENSFHS